MAKPHRPICATEHRGSKVRWQRRAAWLGALAIGLAVVPASAQSILSLLANSMNGELPRAFGNHTRLMHVSAAGNTLGFEFEVAPESPLAKGIDLKAQAATLCKVEMFRSMMDATKAALHVTYRRPDRTPLGEFTIDRTICRS